MTTHRDKYPEQYEHPLVGKEVEAYGIRFLVARVVNTRFGQLAVSPGSDQSFSVKDCTVVEA